MFFRFSPLLILFLLQIFLPFQVFAYSNQGVDHVNPEITIKLAQNHGLVISKHERAVKKQLLKQKKAHPKEFKKQFGKSIENSDVLQGYLLEIQDGLSKVEKAKQIAKYRIYTQVEKNWPDLQMTALNVNNDKSFKQFQNELLRDLNEHLNYRSSTGNKNYYFELQQWATATVTQNLRNVTWKIEFNHKHDNNKLEKGVDDIKIEEENAAPQPSDDGGGAITPAPSQPFDQTPSSNNEPSATPPANGDYR